MGKFLKRINVVTVGLLCSIMQVLPGFYSKHSHGEAGSQRAWDQQPADTAMFTLNS